MRSRLLEAVSPNAGPRSLAGRVAQATALTAALGAAAAAVGSGTIAYRLIVAREDTTLRDAALTLAYEIKPGADDETAGRAGDAEAQEIAHTGQRITVFAGERRLGGDPILPSPGHPGCATVAPAGTRLRMCTVAAGARSIAVASRFEPIAAVGEALAIAAAVGVVLAALAAALASRRVARWAIGPLLRLRVAVADVPAAAPSQASLPPPEGCDEVDALAATIAAMLTRLDAALGQARRFASDAAHELRSPLAAIRAEVELALEDGGEAAARPDDTEALGRVHRSVVALSALVDRLLVLAMPGDSALRDGRAVAMTDVIADAVGALPPERRERVVLRLDDEGMVRGDAPLLRSMIDNAIDNALKFDPAGVTTVSLSARDSHVVSVVHDCGPGVAATDRARVFEPFYRTPQARASAAGGHGIGLALVAHVAACHGGRAEFVEAERGARLEIALPAWHAGPS